jgi:hypothetical protein
VHPPERVTIETEGADNGKSFLLYRMPALQAEDWIWRCALAMTQAGVKISQDQIDQGFAALASLLLDHFGRIPWQEARALRYEMLPYIKREMVNEKSGSVVVRPLVEVTMPSKGDSYDVEQPSTWFLLRWRYLRMYEDFFDAAGRSILVLWAAAASKAPSVSQTSPPSSGPSSAPA